ncbi:HAMP domain-containing sensor histidine kinase [Cryobacterium sp. 5B3]|uniref:sensor histidine kinase n=1 Tax=Cryobacterium sp. 5B3 TaxID=3048586 RepID=UPI002AB45C38|nr:HAMP domain-containing sensor histidine kinase [Cryobacterium sp. 5B3]MDY7541836.1 HAMP domain-containing sensor histidine kinase [Cryobacterium sp. 5B3]MEB0274234.1 HAMP domain-containing sensor histidine kinase [Cryobacterium sp. 5B3]
MSGEIWELFPFPTLIHNTVIDGSLLPAHPACVSCPTKACASDDKAVIGEANICRYGVTYSRVDDNRLVTGVLVSDGTNMNSRAKRRLRTEPERRITASKIARSIERARSLGAGVTTDFDILKMQVLQKLEHEPEMHKALAQQLTRDFERNVQQSHDFLQLAKLVQGHAEALLAEKYPGLPAQDAAERSPIEGSIFFTTQLMVLKLDSLVFLQDPQRAHERSTNFKIHPMLLKYVRIYRWQADQKELNLRVEGECFSSATYNSQAIGAVLQGVLDNLVKYAPGGSDALVRFDENGSDVAISFNSLGPRIAPNERQSIFLAGFRASAAREVENTGQGIGLATAKQISDVLSLDLSVEQSDDEPKRFPGMYSTTFKFTLRRNS